MPAKLMSMGLCLKEALRSKRSYYEEYNMVT